MRLFLRAHQLAQSLSKRPEFFTVVSGYIPHYQTFFLKRPNRISGQGFLSLAYLARLDCLMPRFWQVKGLLSRVRRRVFDFSTVFSVMDMMTSCFPSESSPFFSTHARARQQAPPCVASYCCCYQDSNFSRR